MKNLWMTLPPLLADTFGLIEVLRESDGCAVVDDGGEFRLSEDRKTTMATRTVVSQPKNEDVITGTKVRVLAAAEEAVYRYRPAFMLFSAGPCGAMIGTDLNEIAEEFEAKSHIPCGVTDLTGQRPYDVGISKTLEAMAKLFARPAKVKAKSVNLIGATDLDLSAQDRSAVKQWIEESGYTVIAEPGGWIRAEEIRRMGEADINAVFSVSGLAMARYLKKTCGTPYVAVGSRGLMDQNRQLVDGNMEDFNKREVTTLIIAEQFRGNALRQILESLLPDETADVGTFYMLDKEFARSGDRRIRGESDAATLLGSGTYRRVIADPLLAGFAAKGTAWIDLCHPAFHTYGEAEAPMLFGERGREWLSEKLKGEMR